MYIFIQSNSFRKLRKLAYQANKASLGCRYLYYNNFKCTQVIHSKIIFSITHKNNLKKNQICVIIAIKFEHLSFFRPSNS